MNDEQKIWEFEVLNKELDRLGIPRESVEEMGALYSLWGRVSKLLDKHSSRLSTLEAAVEERDATIKKLRDGIFNMLASHGYVDYGYNEPENCICTDCNNARALLAETAPKVQS